MIDKTFFFIPDRPICLIQSSKIFPLRIFFTFISLRYFLGGYRPSKTVSDYFFTVFTVKFQGSSRLPVSRRYLHRQYNFTRSIRKTVTPSLSLFMQDNTYLPRNFATLGSLELQPPVFTVYGLILFLIFSFHFANLGKSHCAYFIIYFAHSCVCGQQLQGYFCRVPFNWLFASLLNHLC